jgi:biopolymer transport protein ExbD
LRSALTLRHRADPLNSVAYVRADKNLEYRKVQFVLDLAGQAGMRVVGLITERAPTANKPNHPF